MIEAGWLIEIEWKLWRLLVNLKYDKGVRRVYYYGSHLMASDLC